MIFADRKRNDADTPLKKAMERYREVFGTEYVFWVGFPVTEDEAIAEIEKCIRENKPQKEPTYEEGRVY